ncbi:MAG TPA: hypothetical protein VFE53_15920 [Mucilaginibacter sp.]|jgi:hypothetical protein|nr:hypothetical protein [Mucilaginibacter sp.]
MKKVKKVGLVICVFITGVFSSQILLAQAVDSLDIGATFSPAGYMGCVKQIRVDEGWTTNPHSPPVCSKFTYAIDCNLKWAGVYWKNIVQDTTGGNWGQSPGMDLSHSNFTRITFWARGDVGGEIITFGAFGIDNTHVDPQKFPYKDSCPKVSQTVSLTRNWQKYTINLTCQDMSSVIGGFLWSASYTSNPNGLVFYLDDIHFER